MVSGLSAAVAPDLVNIEGLEQTWLQAHSEFALRTAGIRIAQSNDVGALSPLLAPLLSVTVNGVAAPTPPAAREPYMYEYTVHIELKQAMVRLIDLLEPIKRKTLTLEYVAKEFHTAPTWQFEVGGIIGSKKIEKIQVDVKNGLDEFINDWLAANERQSGRSKK